MKVEKLRDKLPDLVAADYGLADTSVVCVELHETEDSRVWNDAVVLTRQEDM